MSEQGIERLKYNEDEMSVGMSGLLTEWILETDENYGLNVCTDGRDAPGENVGERISLGWGGSGGWAQLLFPGESGGVG